ncbi:MAG TPA: hypothetical protein VEV87_08415 [Chitinophagaceae bacterium]|nr:hypothetical protein [Chitinophagaceae bacterium]
MKNLLPCLALVACLVVFACKSHKYYQSDAFAQATKNHRLIAVVPAEMIFTGTPPKKLTAEDISKIEEAESIAFQESLYNGILRHANGRKYYTTVELQDISTTRKILVDNNLPNRKAWGVSDKELVAMLNVDAVVRMRIQKKRYMGDLASYGIDLAKQIGWEYAGGKIPGTPFGIPNVKNNTNDIYATCSLLSDGRTLWNDDYKRASDWNNPANEIIEGITDNFGRHFPYKQRR